MIRLWVSSYKEYLHKKGADIWGVFAKIWILFWMGVLIHLAVQFILIPFHFNDAHYLSVLITLIAVVIIYAARHPRV